MPGIKVLVLLSILLFVVSFETVDAKRPIVRKPPIDDDFDDEDMDLDDNDNDLYEDDEEDEDDFQDEQE